MIYDPSLDYLDGHQLAVIRMAHDLSDRHMCATGMRPSRLHLSKEAWNAEGQPIEVAGLRITPDRKLPGFSGAVFAR